MRDKIKEFLEKEGVILPKDFVAELYLQMLKMAGPFSGLIQNGSKRAGKVAARSLIKSLSITDKEVPEALKHFFSLAGFGDVEVIVEGNVLKVHVKDSFLFKSHDDPKKSLSPLAGAIQGFVEEFIGKELKVSIEDKTIVIIT